MSHDDIEPFQRSISGPGSWREGTDEVRCGRKEGTPRPPAIRCLAAELRTLKKNSGDMLPSREGFGT
ncbi:MAG TPA: hypothetical protein PKJ75_07535 [Methanosarcina vacuolata]|nr:hypothetical protein [Methanosarcina vacuolata]